MTTTAEIVERLRQMDAQAARDSGGRHQAGESVFAAAADHIETLARERDRAVEGLREARVALVNERNTFFESVSLVDGTVPDHDDKTTLREMNALIGKVGLILSDIDTESEGER